MSEKFPEVKNITELTDESLEYYTVGAKDYPIHLTKIEEGEPKSVLFIGDNATGKSFYSSILKSVSEKLGWSGYNIGMKLRTQSGITRMFLADEDIGSTGAGSISNMKNAIKNIKKEDGKNKRILVLDEPTIGLSHRYEKAMGEYIATELKEMVELDHFAGMFLTTHCKEMIREMMSCGIHFTVYTTSDYKSLNDWLNEEDHATVEELLALPGKGMECFREISSYKQNKKG